MDKVFHFTNCRSQEAKLTFIVPSDSTTSQELISAYGRGLNAPNGYFGNNWDAFKDMLMDLDWINETQINLVHFELPSLEDRDLAIYLHILNTASKEWSSPKTIELKKQFPEFIVHELYIEFAKNLESKVFSLFEESIS